MTAKTFLLREFQRLLLRDSYCDGLDCALLFVLIPYAMRGLAVHRPSPASCQYHMQGGVLRGAGLRRHRDGERGALPPGGAAGHPGAAGPPAAHHHHLPPRPGRPPRPRRPARPRACPPARALARTHSALRRFSPAVFAAPSRTCCNWSVGLHAGSNKFPLVAAAIQRRGSSASPCGGSCCYVSTEIADTDSVPGATWIRHDRRHRPVLSEDCRCSVAARCPAMGALTDCIRSDSSCMPPHSGRIVRQGAHRKAAREPEGDWLLLPVPLPLPSLSEQFAQQAQSLHSAFHFRFAC